MEGDVEGTSRGEAHSDVHASVGPLLPGLGYIRRWLLHVVIGEEELLQNVPGEGESERRRRRRRRRRREVYARADREREVHTPLVVGVGAVVDDGVRAQLHVPGELGVWGVAQRNQPCSRGGPCGTVHYMNSTAAEHPLLRVQWLTWGVPGVGNCGRVSLKQRVVGVTLRGGRRGRAASRGVPCAGLQHSSHL